MPINYEKEIVRITEKNCKHDRGFHAQSLSNSTYIMACNWRCGYFLRWDPTLAGSIRDSHWREHGVLYTEKPVEGKRIDINYKAGEL